MRKGPRVKFKSKNLTRVYWDLQKASTRFVLNYGGAGSSKSYSQAQLELYKALEKRRRILIIRKTGRTLDDSVVELLKTELLDGSGMRPAYSYNKSTRTLTLANGSQFLFRGIDDPEKIKSIQGIDRVWIEEASELTEEDFDQINLRLRSSDDIQISLTFNPISVHHWIKQRFIDVSRKDVTIIHSTYKDNPFLPETYIEQLRLLKQIRPDRYEVYALGRWGHMASGDEFYRNFSNDLVGEPDYDPEMPLHVSFDFNMVPYNTATVYQVSQQGESFHIAQIDEICLESPNNRTTDVANEFARRYRGHRPKVFIYGDPSGRARGTRDKDGRHDFSIIERILDPYFTIIDMVPGRAPSVSDRGDFANALFIGWNGMSFVVHENCSRSIEDFLYVKMNADGTKVKQKGKDPETGSQYEKYGHTSDSFDYFLTSCFDELYSVFLYGDEPARTSGGRRKKREVRF